ncbi:hypothetical protein E2C01_022226 [Portunus trituberculatus]|uniref:Uncharacterized protein n=1 Tax=Portunus trituberculatus TaxID=210409 RepID=A0A5B7E4T9_PORTR|nr:hypothetical protein [Portunus trituberculatus]
MVENLEVGAKHNQLSKEKKHIRNRGEHGREIGKITAACYKLIGKDRQDQHKRIQNGKKSAEVNTAGKVKGGMSGRGEARLKRVGLMTSCSFLYVPTTTTTTTTTTSHSII